MGRKYLFVDKISAKTRNIVKEANHMMTKILGAVRQSIKSYEIKSNLDSEEVLVTLLSADIYKGIAQEKKVVKKKTPASMSSNAV